MTSQFARMYPGFICVIHPGQLVCFSSASLVASRGYNDLDAMTLLYNSLSRARLRESPSVQSRPWARLECRQTYVHCIVYIISIQNVQHWWYAVYSVLYIEMKCGEIYIYIYIQCVFKEKQACTYTLCNRIRVGKHTNV